jgi:hypothetical protein
MACSWRVLYVFRTFDIMGIGTCAFECHHRAACKSFKRCQHGPSQRGSTARSESSLPPRDARPKYARFDLIRKKKGPTTDLAADMAKLAISNFTKYIPDVTLQESIFDAAPVPEMDLLRPLKMDDFAKTMMEGRHRGLDKGQDKGLKSIQGRLINTMGPLSQLWIMIDKITKQSESADTTDQIDDIDLFQMLD